VGQCDAADETRGRGDTAQLLCTDAAWRAGLAARAGACGGGRSAGGRNRGRLGGAAGHSREGCRLLCSVFGTPRDRLLDLRPVRDRSAAHPDRGGRRRVSRQGMGPGERRRGGQGGAGRSGVTRAVVLAAGRGERMRAAAPDAVLEPAQSAAADLGLKGLIPFAGQPFLAYVLTALADAGYREVCIVTGGSPDAVREYFERVQSRRLRIRFAVQQTPSGSASAVAAAGQFAGGGEFIVINSDNLYT